jgi:hypothetical protein
MSIFHNRIISSIVPLLKITKRRIKKKDLFSKESTSIRMKGFEGKNYLIKHDVSRDVNSSSGHFKALNSVVSRAVA